MNQKQLKKNKGSGTKKNITEGKPYERRWGNQFAKAYTTQEIEKLADELLSWMEIKMENLWFKDFLVEKRIDGNRVGEFTQKNEYFAWIMALCKNIQESRMFKLGTSKKVNPAMFIIGLKNNHNWSDQVEVKANLNGHSTFLKSLFNEINKKDVDKN